MRLIIKRDGSCQNYCFDKVERVIGLAFKSVGKEPPAEFIQYVKGKLDKLEGDSINVEEVQDIIQNALITKNKYDVVASFIRCRKEREETRLKESDFVKSISERLRGGNIQNQNANVDEEAFGGRKGEAMSIVCKNDALNNVMSKKSRKNHENNQIYIHDLDSYSDGETNCLTEPEDKLLTKGFKTRQCDIRPAGSVNTATQLVAVTFQLQSLQQFGGVSASHIDWTMVPFIRKSFKKAYVANYIETLDDFYELDLHTISDKDLDEWVSKKVADFYLDNPKFKSKSVWKFKNKSLFEKKLYQKALFETRNEIYQAVEGLYHKQIVA